MNIAQYLSRAAAQWPDKPALYTDGALHLTFAEWRHQVMQLATRLSNQHGIKPGDRVAVFADNHPHYASYFLATWFLGATIVPINSRLHTREVEWILKDSDATLCVTKAEAREDFQQAGLDCKFLSIEDELYAENTESDSPEYPYDCSALDIAWIFYTSGTTGTPKGVMISHENIRQVCLNYLADYDAFSAETRVVHFAPQSHASGFLMLIALSCGGASVIPCDYTFSVEGVKQLMAEHDKLCAFMAPTMLRKLLDFDLDDHLSSFDTIIYGGGPMYLADIREAVDRLGGRFAQLYGQGEAPMTITRLTRQQIIEAHAKNENETLNSVGYAFTGVEVAVVDPDGKLVDTGEVGEIVVRGPVVMKGYFNKPEATAETIRDGWLYTGDMGLLSEAGMLTLKDRNRDVVISGGLNIYPREIEEVILQHPAVSEIAVIGKADPKWGESLVACVVPRPGKQVTEDTLEQWCRDHLAGFKCPRIWRFLDALPKNNYGKVLKRELRGDD